MLFWVNIHSKKSWLLIICVFFYDDGIRGQYSCNLKLPNVLNITQAFITTIIFVLNSYILNYGYLKLDVWISHQREECELLWTLDTESKNKSMYWSHLKILLYVVF